MWLKIYLYRWAHINLYFKCANLQPENSSCPYIVAHIGCCTQISWLTYRYTFSHKTDQMFTNSNIHSRSKTHMHVHIYSWHIHSFTRTCLHMYSTKWPFQGIHSNWNTNTYSQMLPLTTSFTHIIHNLKIHNVFTWMHEYKHAHIHLGAEIFAHRRKHTHTSFHVHPYVILMCSHYIN